MATTGVSPGRVGASLLYLVGFVLIAAVIGRPLVRAALRAATRSAEPGPTVATAVVVILLGAVATQALGLEPEFGAFVAGILLGAPGAAEPSRLAPLRTVVLSVLAPLFLASAGLRMDLTLLGDQMILLAAIAVVVAMVGLRLGVLSTATYTIVVLVAIVTSLMAPPLLRLAMARVEHSAEERRMSVQYRQGDILLVAVEAVPDNAVPVPREGDQVVLAYGGFDR